MDNIYLILILIGVVILGKVIAFTYIVHYENYVIRKKLGNRTIDGIMKEHSETVNTRREKFVIHLAKKGGLF